MSKRNPHYQYSYDIEDIRNRTDRSLLVVMDTESCPKIFQDDVAFFDEVTELHISCDSPTSKKDCKDLVKFHNLEYLNVSDLTLEMNVWIDFARNCKRLKKLHFYCGSSDWFYFDEGTFSELLKIPTLEKLLLKKLSLPFWPKGPSNLKYMELVGIGEKGNDDTLTQYQNNFHTHQKLTEINIIITNLNTNPFLISTLNLEKCLNLETITIRTVEDNLHESIHKILQLPKLKKISFVACQMEYFVTDNSLIFPSVEEIYIGVKGKYYCNPKCFKYIEDEINGSCEIYPHKKVTKIYSYGSLLWGEYPPRDNVKAMLTQCPNLKICTLNGLRLFGNMLNL